jgi:hypothetical protein
MANKYGQSRKGFHTSPIPISIKKKPRRSMIQFPPIEPQNLGAAADGSDSSWRMNEDAINPNPRPMRMPGPG